nr:MAG TPA: hypothetical protein [Caudoviricetes sp.]
MTNFRSLFVTLRNVESTLNLRSVNVQLMLNSCLKKDD